jgi:hypothetical protein
MIHKTSSGTHRSRTHRHGNMHIAQESRLSLLPSTSKCRLDPDTGDWRPGFCQGYWDIRVSVTLKGEEAVFSPNQRTRGGWHLLTVETTEYSQSGNGHFLAYIPS